jgi:hypothetical protein
MSFHVLANLLLAVTHQYYSLRHIQSRSGDYVVGLRGQIAPPEYQHQMDTVLSFEEGGVCLLFMWYGGDESPKRRYMKGS